MSYVYTILSVIAVPFQQGCKAVYQQSMGKCMSKIQMFLGMVLTPGVKQRVGCSKKEPVELL
jgi:hypothetical protein